MVNELKTAYAECSNENSNSSDDGQIDDEEEFLNQPTKETKFDQSSSKPGFVDSLMCEITES